MPTPGSPQEGNPGFPPGVPHQGVLFSGYPLSGSNQVVPSNGPLQRVLFRISRPEGPIKGVPFSYPPPKFYPGLSFKWVTSRVPLHRGPSSDPLQEYTITCPLHGIHLRCSSTRSSPGCPLQMVPFRGTLPGRSSWGIPSANSPQGGRLPRVPTRGATHGPFHENP